RGGVPLPARPTRKARLWPAEFLLVFVVAVNHTPRPPSDICHGAVSSVQVETDRAETFCETGDILGFVKHPALRYHREDLKLLVRDRVADRLALGADDTGHIDTCLPPVQVPLEGDW